MEREGDGSSFSCSVTGTSHSMFNMECPCFTLTFVKYVYIINDRFICGFSPCFSDCAAGLPVHLLMYRLYICIMMYSIISK